MAARRSRGLGQLVLDPRAQGFSARGAAPDAPLHHRRSADAVLINENPPPERGGRPQAVGWGSTFQLSAAVQAVDPRPSLPLSGGGSREGSDGVNSHP